MADDAADERLALVQKEIMELPVQHIERLLEWIPQVLTPKRALEALLPRRLPAQGRSAFATEPAKHEVEEAEVKHPDVDSQNNAKDKFMQNAKEEDKQRQDVELKNVAHGTEQRAKEDAQQRDEDAQKRRFEKEMQNIVREETESQKFTNEPQHGIEKESQRKAVEEMQCKYQQDMQLDRREETNKVEKVIHKSYEEPRQALNEEVRHRTDEQSWQNAEEISTQEAGQEAKQMAEGWQAKAAEDVELKAIEVSTQRMEEVEKQKVEDSLQTKPEEAAVQKVEERCSPAPAKLMPPLPPAQSPDPEPAALLAPPTAPAPVLASVAAPLAAGTAAPAEPAPAPVPELKPLFQAQEPPHSPTVQSQIVLEPRGSVAKLLHPPAAQLATVAVAMPAAAMAAAVAAEPAPASLPELRLVLGEQVPPHSPTLQSQTIVEPRCSVAKKLPPPAPLAVATSTSAVAAEPASAPVPELRPLLGEQVSPHSPTLQSPSVVEPRGSVAKKLPPPAPLAEATSAAVATSAMAAEPATAPVPEFRPSLGEQTPPHSLTSQSQSIVEPRGSVAKKLHSPGAPLSAATAPVPAAAAAAVVPDPARAPPELRPLLGEQAPPHSPQLQSQSIVEPRGSVEKLHPPEAPLSVETPAAVATTSVAAEPAPAPVPEIRPLLGAQDTLEPRGSVSKQLPSHSQPSQPLRPLQQPSLPPPPPPPPPQPQSQESKEEAKQRAEQDRALQQKAARESKRKAAEYAESLEAEEAKKRMRVWELEQEARQKLAEEEDERQRAEEERQRVEEESPAKKPRMSLAAAVAAYEAEQVRAQHQWLHSSPSATPMEHEEVHGYSFGNLTEQAAQQICKDDLEQLKLSYEECREYLQQCKSEQERLARLAEILETDLKAQLAKMSAAERAVEERKHEVEQAQQQYIAVNNPWYEADVQERAYCNLTQVSSIHSQAVEDFEAELKDYKDLACMMKDAKQQRDQAKSEEGNASRAFDDMKKTLEVHVDDFATSGLLAENDQADLKAKISAEAEISVRRPKGQAHSATSRKKQERESNQAGSTHPRQPGLYRQEGGHPQSHAVPSPLHASQQQLHCRANLHPPPQQDLQSVREAVPRGQPAKPAQATFSAPPRMYPTVQDAQELREKKAQELREKKARLMAQVLLAEDASKQVFGPSTAGRSS